MKKEFYITTRVVNDNQVQDFVTYDSNNNPCRKNQLPITTTTYTGTITSIPSPYARMHVTDLAFGEMCSAGYRRFGQNGVGAQLSPDYTKAMSHCLDMFELLFHADDLNLKEKGISVQKIKIWNLNDEVNNTNFKDKVRKNPKSQDLTPLGRYIQSLDFYREQYLSDINVKKQTLLNAGKDFLFDFSSLYIFKYNNKTFAATSPFTGFFTKADCDLTPAGLQVTLQDGTPHTLLSIDDTDYREFSERSEDFKKFMYLLLKETGLEHMYSNLFEVIRTEGYVATNIKNNTWATIDFKTEPQYRKFDISPANLLQQIQGSTAYIRPDGVDCSYLKFLLFLVTPADLNIPEASYSETNINQRQFPENSGRFIPWIGANDILSDALFVLPYEINNNYQAISYTDVKDGQIKRRLLVPIKPEILKYVALQTLISNIDVTKRSDGSFLVRLKILLANGGHTMLRREYFAPGTENRNRFPYGLLCEGDKMNNFAFGVYPFAHSGSFDNFHKILFYNSFSQIPQVDFYVNNANVTTPLLGTAIKLNTTNKISNPNNNLRANCTYYHIEASRGKLNLANIKVANWGNALIIPQMPTIPLINGETTIAVDLGTSNTYVAYMHRVDGANYGPIEEVDTTSGNATELIFLHSPHLQSEIPSASPKNLSDLYLKDAAGNISSECLSAQLSEFIPSQINQSGYKFPIPSAINMLRIDDARTVMPQVDDIIPLINSSIPFAYYELGTRKMDGITGLVDLVSDGSNFKWFTQRDNNGFWNINVPKQTQFSAFMEELLFIVRTHILVRGYDLNRCRLVWSYPLSFDPTLADAYAEAWQQKFSKYINPNRANLIQTNESLTPIHYCLNILAAAGNLHLIVDIGGGSTDIIGYQQDAHGNLAPQFISSFGFAGNALYLEGGNLNNPINNMNETLIKARIIDKCNRNEISIFSQNGQLNTQPISLDAKVSVLMNYGFSVDETHFKSLFSDAPIQFMLSLHNAAIIYQTAQLCKLAGQPKPMKVFFTGNGSRLIQLNTNYQNMFQTMFNTFYEDNNVVQYDFPANPKVATAQGALIGIKNNMPLQGDDVNNCIKTMLGDNQHIYNGINPNIGNNIDYHSLVEANVRVFLQLWYDTLSHNLQQVLSYEQILALFNQITNNAMLNIPNGQLSDSLFFQYIALLLEQISMHLKASLLPNIH